MSENAEKSNNVVKAVLLGGWATALGACAVLGKWETFSLALASGLAVLVLYVMRAVALFIGESADARAKALSDVLEAPEKFSRVWLETGHNEGEYAYLWAQSKDSPEKLCLATASTHQDAMRQLNERGIPIHNGPPGTVS